ncbi:DUF2076 domain-containing protein [Vibrio sp. S4M6]|uniref:DUF2076 domain-containing protein n=1 Tax=Vibrio sinus TaxID=2946865 RepID=UPI00202A75A3|nr:DUF2076 domain-containing protein [Vibrio sinus]MCL9783518.1 DUF2076 domain-containing protein [Vibrio sinus]
MNADEKALIENLAQRLQQAQLSDIDTDAEKLIQKLMSNQPRSMYLLTQAVLLQEQALKASQEKIQQLEQEVQQASSSPKKSGFLSGLFGGTSQSTNRSSTSGFGNGGFGQQSMVNNGYSSAYSQPQNNYSQAQNFRPSRGSSFMGQAASTALGVAGGALLFEGVSHMLGGGGILGGGRESIVNETIINEAPGGNQFDGSDMNQNMDSGGWNDTSSGFMSGNDGLGTDNWNNSSPSDAGFGNVDNGAFNNDSGFDNSGFDSGGFDDSSFGGFDGGGFDDNNW